MKFKSYLKFLAVLLLSACGGGGSSTANYSAIVGLALDDPATPTKLYVTNADNQTIQTVNLSTLAVSVLAGGANTSGTTDANGTAARFSEPYGVVRVSSTEFYVADSWNHGIRKMTSAGAVSTLVGSLGTHGSDDGIGTAATFYVPKGLDTDGTNLYVVDSFNHTIRQVVISSKQVNTLAGYAGTTSASGAVDGTGTAARFNFPFGVVYSGGFLYVTDMGNQAIRKVTLAGAVTTLAGSTSAATGSADATGTAATFNTPTGIVSDGTYLYVADTGNHTIRKVAIANGAVTTLAGTAGSSGSTDGTGTAARFNNPVGLVLDNAGNLYVSDQWYTKIRKVVTSTGVVTTLAATF
jgi:hypothetical protein